MKLGSVISKYHFWWLTITPTGAYGEFLVVFSEFGVFVDPYGRRSREVDVKFTRVPVDVTFNNGALYLIYTNAVEVIQIKADSFVNTSVEGKVNRLILKFFKESSKQKICPAKFFF